MSAIKIVSRKRAIISYGEHYDDESLRTVVRFRASKRFVTALLKSRRNQNALVGDLQASGILSENGCNCSHCARDYDCCGNWICYGATIQRASRGFVAIQTFSRNC